MQQEKQNVRQELAWISGPSPAGQGPQTVLAKPELCPLQDRAGEGSALPTDASWEFPALTDLCKAEAYISLEK